ncbi:nuclear transport factor 2 family protein [Algoriphagus chordae]|uniref:SnoaL-like protein n=1 Tax=Algoriphagus chordae TaxID=237019 RepID=A0A2W7RBE8_9BACT|nr:nuclear transport factor 2 family protein [Algoriphagus chordae]PZX55580.1 SnoaL-like protein [Algoriphagus chordae]
MKNIIFPLLLSSFLIASCNTLNDHSEENISLIENYIKAVEDLDHDSMEAMLDENYLGLGPSYGDSVGKSQAVQNWKHNVDNLYEKIEYIHSKNAAIKITTGDNQGDWVANWSELHITYKAEKAKVIIWANSIYQIENNKIVKSYTFYNEADALNQLGYVFINPNDL